MRILAAIILIPMTLAAMLVASLIASIPLSISLGWVYATKLTRGPIYFLKALFRW